MSISTFQVLRSLVPKAKCAVYESTSENICNITWSDSRTQPTASEIAAERTRLEAQEAKDVLRRHRDFQLRQSDWRANSDVTMSDAWKTYRQALRDLPASANPTVDSNGELNASSVTWPTEPS